MEHNTRVARLFDECQASFAVHKKCSAMMRQLKNSSEKHFREAFLLCLDRILLVFKRGATIERLVQFVINFATNTEEEDGADDGFDVFLLEYLVAKANAKDKAVRFRVCQIIGGLLKGLGDDAEISDEVWDDIVDKMVERANDKIASVRVQAVHALNRLQDPSDAEDHVTALYVRLLNSDTCKDVRKAVLSNIGVSRSTLLEIMGRFRDVDKDVRKRAFEVLAEKVNVRQLSISQRIEVLDHGLKDREEVVKSSCAKLLCEHWLASQGFDPIKLLEKLDVENFEESAERAVTCILDYQFQYSGGMNSEVARGLAAAAAWVWDPTAAATGDATTAATLTAEQALYWRCRCQFVASAEKGGQYYRRHVQDEMLEELLPETSDFCDLIASMCLKKSAASGEDQEGREAEDSDDNFFVTMQMLKLSAQLDFHDEVGRQRLLVLLRGLLQALDTPDTLLPTVVEVLRKIHTGEDEHVRFVVETIAEIHDPLESQGEKQREEEGRKEMAGGAMSDGGDDGGDEDEEDEEVVPEPLLRWLRVLLLTGCLLKHVTAHRGNALLLSLLDHILPAITSDFAPLRHAAVEGLGLYCMMDASIATKHVRLLTHICRNEHEEEEITVTATKLLFDLIMLFPGLLATTTATTADHAAEGGEGEAQGSRGVLEALLACLDDRDRPRMCSAGAEGFAKLLFVNRLPESAVPVPLAKLAALYFDPPAATEEEQEEEEEEEQEESVATCLARMQQALSLFFPAYAMASAHHQRMLERVAVDQVWEGQLLHAHAFAAPVPTKRATSKSRAKKETGRTLPPALCGQLLQYTLFLLAEPAAAGADEHGQDDAEGCAGLGQESWSFHERVGLQICAKLLASPTGAHCKELCKVLPCLQVGEADTEDTVSVATKALYAMAARAAKLIKDKTLTKQVQKFSERLAESAGADDAESGICAGAMDLSEAQLQALDEAVGGIGGKDATAASAAGSAGVSQSRVKAEVDTAGMTKKSSRRKLHSNRRQSLSDDEGDEENENVNANVPPARTRHSRSSKASAKQKIRQSVDAEDAIVKVEAELVA